MTPNAQARAKVERASLEKSGPTVGAQDIPAAHEAVLATLVYYRLFNFPLTLQETHRLSGHRGPQGVTEAALDWLVERGVAGRQDDLVFLGDASQVSERRADEGRAVEAAARIRRRARMIGRFPFVRGVGLSGSASKGIMKPGDDVDFFVITAPGRLWACRALLMLFKKVFLLNSHRLFCVNYLVAEDRLTLPDHNVYTAMEIAWLRPMWGAGWYEAFLAANQWLVEFLPNWRPFEDPVPAHASGWAKRILERSLSGPAGDRFDDWLRAKIAERNRRRYRHLPPEEFESAFRSESGVSKHHPAHYQRRVTDQYRAAIQEWRSHLARALSASESAGGPA